MSNTLSGLSFARPIVRWPDRLPGALIELGLCRVVEDDEELVQYLLGQESFPEAFENKASRDRALGMASDYIEFVPTSWNEAQTAGFDVGLVAIGPGLGEPSFDEVATLVLSARSAGLSDLENPAERIGIPSRLIIKRVAYHVGIQRDGNLSVGAAPLYARCDKGLVMATAEWLTQRFESERLKTFVIG